MIASFIRKVFKERVDKHRALVIYDKERRYEQLVSKLMDQNTEVVLSGEDALDAWEKIIAIWPKLVEDTKRLIIHVPFDAPVSDHDKVVDPYYAYALSGTIFPDGPSDEYKQLCKQAFPDQQIQIDQLFSEEAPSFETVDNLGAGESWPKLQALLEESSDKEIILAIMLPDDEQKQKLMGKSSWHSEFKRFTNARLGLKPKLGSFSDIQDELWQYVLYSEFVFDLPINLPDKLSKVPKADDAMKDLILSICSEIRKQKYIEEIYIMQANKVDDQLSLSKLFADEDDLGVIATFSFEDRTDFKRFCLNLSKKDLHAASNTLKKKKANIWSEYDQERQAYWQIARQAFNIIEKIDQLRVSLPKSFDTPDHAFQVYGDKLWTIDQEQRYFEQAVLNQFEKDHNLEAVIENVRKHYFEFVEVINKLYQKTVIAHGWHFDKMLRNDEYFDKKVLKQLKNNRKVAFYMVDAMRYEIAQDIKTKISSSYDAELEPAAAFLPTITKFAMAALLPGAAKKLELKSVGTGLEPFIEGNQIKGPTERLSYIQEILGDRVEMIKLSDLRNTKKLKSQTELLVIPSAEIDTSGESLANKAQNLIEQVIGEILQSFTKLKQLGIEVAYLAADHGFVLHPEYEAGNALSKPDGAWVMKKSRVLAGKGSHSSDMISFTADQLGINTDVENFVFLRNYATFKRGTTYFHEGLSLQENVVPCLEVTLKDAVKPIDIQIAISYKAKKAGVITTRRPSIEIACFGDRMFAEPVSVKIEAISKDKLVGKPSVGDRVDISTNWVLISPAETDKISLNMDDDFEGKFEVIASDPISELIFDKIELETDYL